MTKIAKSQSLFQSNSAKELWDMADNANLGVMTLAELYPMTVMPNDIARIKVEILELQIFKDKDREKAMAWLNENFQLLD